MTLDRITFRTSAEVNYLLSKLGTHGTYNVSALVRKALTLYLYKILHIDINTEQHTSEKGSTHVL